jgi:PAS domain-containing protein
LQHGRAALLSGVGMSTLVKRQKNLALIRAREIATNLSIPITLFDPDGTIVFYNRAAETMMGTTFEERGEIAAEEWTMLFAPETPDGKPLPLEELPTGIALTERKPHHRELCFTDAEGNQHEVSVTGFPLIGRENELFGAVTVFWVRR